MMRKTKHFLSLALSVLAFTACTQEDISTLPGGRQPLTLTATIAGGADTRATVDDDWTVGDEVALWVQEDGIFHYRVTDSRLGTMIGDYYWQNTGSKYIQAIYPYDAVKEGSSDLQNISWNVKENQNEHSGYEDCDLLCSEQLSVNGEYVPPINFYHQTAKIVVNVKQDGLPESINAEPGDITLTIGGDNRLTLDGTFTPPINGGSDGWLGTWTPGSTTGSINPHLATTTPSGCFATYEALVIPQDVAAGTKLLTFTATKNGIIYGPFYYALDNNITWNSGYAYTYDITIFHYGLDVQVSEGFGWESGTGCSGSVELDY